MLRLINSSWKNIAIFKTQILVKNRTVPSVEPIVAIDKLTKCTLTIFILSAVILGCNNPSHNTANDENKEVKSQKNPSGWKILECGLYIDANGEIGFPTRPDYVFKEDELEGEDKMCPNKFITILYDSISLNKIIDTNTFRSLGASFYVDKNNIYNHYTRCDGGNLYLFSEDTSDFEMLNNEFARHHSSIYHFRSGKLDADIETFKASSRFTSVARDKDGYFQFGERVTKEQLKRGMGIERFIELEKELRN